MKPSPIQVCICHVTITGDLPATNLFISIMAIFQVIFSLLLFVKVFKKRIEMNNDIKYGIEPLPDPFELTINPRNISYVQGSNKYIDGYDSLEERNFYNALSKKGGRFDSTFNNAQTTSNPSRFQISNGVKRQVFTNGAFLVRCLSLYFESFFYINIMFHLNFAKFHNFINRLKKSITSFHNPIF